MKHIITALLTGTLLLTGCSKEIISESEPVEFQNITILNNDCTATNYCYEAQVDQEGVWLRAWTEDMSQDETEEPDYYREYHADQEVEQQISQMLGKCQATDWDGFNKSNPDIMDGSSFRFSMTLEDGSTIKAYGSNTSPDNYADFESYFLDLILVKDITEQHFEGNQFSMTLPEDWIGCTSVEYECNGLTFYLTGQKNNIFILSVDLDDSDYSDTYENAIKAGTLVNDDGKEYYVTIRANNRISTEDRADANDNEYILDELQDQAKTITESIQGINGYTFIPYNE